MTHLHPKSQKHSRSHAPHFYAQVRNYVPYKNNVQYSNMKYSYVSRSKRFANVKCFYCIILGHTSNIYYYRKLHLQLLPLDYFDANQPRPTKV